MAKFKSTPFFTWQGDSAARAAGVRYEWKVNGVVLSEEADFEIETEKLMNLIKLSEYPKTGVNGTFGIIEKETGIAYMVRAFVQISPTNTHGDWIVLSEKGGNSKLSYIKSSRNQETSKMDFKLSDDIYFNTYGADIPGKPLSMGMGNNLTNIGVLGAVSVMTDQVAYEFNCESMLKVEKIERQIQTAIVTGPTGAVGTALCSRLLQAGCTVVAVCRPGSPRAVALPKDANRYVVACDAANLADLPQCMAAAGLPVQADAFFHLAWAHTIGAGRNDMPAQIENIRYTIDAVRTAAAMGCRVFVGTGSQAEYGRVDGVLRADTPTNPENGYGMAKLCAGQMSRTEAAALGMDHVWARILSVYGPHDGPNTMISATIQKLLAGQCPDLTAGEQKWDYLYSADAADALYRMACHGRSGAVYPVGSGTARPLREYIETLRDAIDPALPLGLGKIPYGPQQVMFLQADITQLAADTGFAPRTAFADGIRATIAWAKTQKQTN